MMSTEKLILSPEGYQKLVEELNYLKTKKRREVAAMLERARAHGDLRENAEYDAAKEAKQQLEIRIATMEAKLSNVRIVDSRELPSDKAYLGTTLELKNLQNGESLRYTLVAQDEADFSKGKISVTSRIGKGLLGKVEGEVAEIQIPAGKIQFQILKLTRE